MVEIVCMYPLQVAGAGIWLMLLYWLAIEITMVFPSNLFILLVVIFMIINVLSTLEYSSNAVFADIGSICVFIVTLPSLLSLLLILFALLPVILIGLVYRLAKDNAKKTIISA